MDGARFFLPISGSRLPLLLSPKFEVAFAEALKSGVSQVATFKSSWGMVTVTVTGIIVKALLI